MIDTDFIRYAISEKIQQAQVSSNPLKLHREAELLTRRLHENENNMQRLSGNDTE